MVRVILGRRGSGKSRLARLLLSRNPPPWLAILDPLNEHETLSPTQGTGDWIPRLMAETWPVRIVPTTVEEYRLALAALASRNSWHLFLEEVDMYEGPIASVQLAIILNYGRHYQQDITLLARRPAAMPRLATSQADELWIFSMWEPRDVRYIESFSGVDARGIPETEVWLLRAEAFGRPERFAYDRGALTLRAVNGRGHDLTRMDSRSSSGGLEDAAGAGSEGPLAEGASSESESPAATSAPDDGTALDAGD